jgi:hypothetical protein
MLLSLEKFETMKKFILPLFVMTLALGSCNMANEDDYKNLAKDMCDCVNKHAAGLSDGMRETLIAASKDGADSEKLMGDQIMKDVEQGLKDQQALEKIGTEVETCISSLEKKYEDIYTDDTEAEIQKKIVAELKIAKGCELTHALIKISQKAGM